MLLWLHSLSIAVTYSATRSPNLQSPDFVLPALACINNDAPACFQGPMAYTQALALLCWAIQLPWMRHTASHMNQDEAQAYTLHSLKVALLSASAQLRLPEESRRQQRHHRLSSVQLYSRDDTIESLWVQSQIASALIRGWRPTRPQSGPARSLRASLLSGGWSDTRMHHIACLASRATNVHLREGTTGPTLHLPVFPTLRSQKTTIRTKHALHPPLLRLA